MFTRLLDLVFQPVFTEPHRPFHIVSFITTNLYSRFQGDVDIPILLHPLPKSRVSISVYLHFYNTLNVSSMPTNLYTRFEGVLDIQILAYSLSISCLNQCLFFPLYNSHRFLYTHKPLYQISRRSGYANTCLHSTLISCLSVFILPFILSSCPQ